jgi:hypothetical protein
VLELPQRRRICVRIKIRRSNGTIGARGPHVAQPSPDPAADGSQGWREALLALSRPRSVPRLSAQHMGSRPGQRPRLHQSSRRRSPRPCLDGRKLFGVHPMVGVVRVDFCGALMLSAAGRVASVEAHAIRYANGPSTGAEAAPAQRCRFGASWRVRSCGERHHRKDATPDPCSELIRHESTSTSGAGPRRAARSPRLTARRRAGSGADLCRQAERSATARPGPADRETGKPSDKPRKLTTPRPSS